MTRSDRWTLICIVLPEKNVTQEEKVGAKYFWWVDLYTQLIYGASDFHCAKGTDSP